MKNIYFKISNLLEHIENTAMIIIFTIMSLSVFLQIVLRTFFNTTILQLEDISKFSFVWLVFIGVASVFKNEGHVAVTYFVSKMPKKLANSVYYCQYILVICYLIVLIVVGFQFTIHGMSEIVSQLRIASGYIYIIMPISGILSLIPCIGFLLGWEQQKI